LESLVDCVNLVVYQRLVEDLEQFAEVRDVESAYNYDHVDIAPGASSPL